MAVRLPDRFGLLADYMTRLAFYAITANEVRAASAHHFGAGQLRFAVVGDVAVLRGPLSALGWGDIEVLDATGMPEPMASASKQVH